MTSRSIVITGSCGHIGTSLCKTFLSSGYNIFALDLPESFSSKVFIEASILHKVSPIHVDLSDPNSIVQASTLISERTDSIDAVINNAAYYGNINGFDANFSDESYAAWEQVFKVNAYAPFFLVQHLHSLLLASTFSPSIVNIGTMYTKVGPDARMYENTSMTNPCSYSSSKSALEGITRWLSNTLAPEIRVNMISPGGIFRNQELLFQKRYLNKVPLQRFCTEQDVSDLALFLISQSSSYLTGNNFLLDGGYVNL